MTDETIFDQRRRAFEEQFFHKQEQQLIEVLRKKKEAEAIKAQIREVTGLDDEQDLDALVAAGVTAESVVALTLLPLVMVAWADGEIDQRERDAVIRAAHEQGIEDDSAAGRILADWLNHRPDRALTAAWADYIGALKQQLDADQVEHLRDAIFSRCEEIAAVAGGLLKLGAVSRSERETIDELKLRFDAA